MVVARRQDSARERVVRSRRVALVAAIPVALVALILFVFVLTPASDNDNGSPPLIGAHGRSSGHGGSASDREASSRDGRIRNMREKGKVTAIKMVAGGESGTSGGGGGEGGGDTYAVVVDAVSTESSSVHVYRFDSRMELGEIQKAVPIPYPCPTPLPPTHPSPGTSKPSSDGTAASLRAALCSSLTLQALQRAAAPATTTSASSSSSSSSSSTGSADSHPASAHMLSEPMPRSAAPVCPQGRVCLLPGVLDGLRGSHRGGRGGEGAVWLAASSALFYAGQQVGCTCVPFREISGMILAWRMLLGSSPRCLATISLVFSCALHLCRHPLHEQFGLIPRNNSTAETTAAPTAARITAQHFARIAEETCGIPLQEVSKKFPLMNGQDAPYACLDASYIFHLLTSGLGKISVPQV
ncbi:unnamed protein product [Closterium sp. NIES-54]